MTAKKTDRAKRRAIRRALNEAFAKDAKSWRNIKSADRMGYARPVNRQATKEFKFK